GRGAVLTLEGNRVAARIKHDDAQRLEMEFLRFGECAFDHLIGLVERDVVHSCVPSVFRLASPGGSGPPVAQSICSTVCTTGVALRCPICIAQPLSPAAITSASSRSIFFPFRSPSWLAISGCRML